MTIHGNLQPTVFMEDGMAGLSLAGCRLVRIRKQRLSKCLSGIGLSRSTRCQSTLIYVLSIQELKNTHYVVE